MLFIIFSWSNQTTFLDKADILLQSQSPPGLYHARGSKSTKLTSLTKLSAALRERFSLQTNRLNRPKFFCSYSIDEDNTYQSVHLSSKKGPAVPSVVYLYSQFIVPRRAPVLTFYVSRQGRTRDGPQNRAYLSLKISVFWRLSCFGCSMDHVEQLTQI